MNAMNIVTPALKILVLDDLYLFTYRGYMVKMKADTTDNRLKATVLIVCQLEDQQCGDWVAYVRRNAEKLLEDIGLEATPENIDAMIDYAKEFDPNDESNFQPI